MDENSLHIYYLKFENNGTPVYYMHTWWYNFFAHVIDAKDYFPSQITRETEAAIINRILKPYNSKYIDFPDVKDNHIVFDSAEDITTFLVKWS